MYYSGTLLIFVDNNHALVLELPFVLTQSTILTSQDTLSLAQTPLAKKQAYFVPSQTLLAKSRDYFVSSQTPFAFSEDPKTVEHTI